MDTTAVQPPHPQFRPWQKGLFASLMVVGVTIAGLLIYFVAHWQTFAVSSNSMAPTLLGAHVTGVCAECGLPAYCSPTAIEYPDPEGPLMICDAFHVSHVQDYDETVHGGDRVAVSRGELPRRWDLAAYYNPDDPTTVYVHRVVGLPGETVVIRDGRVWIDDAPLDMPPGLHGLKYELDMEIVEPLWGTEERPAVLGADEYFVLGDFSKNARDSRLWSDGAPGHHSYAVPRSYILGVASRIYSPLSRARSLRVVAE